MLVEGQATVVGDLDFLEDLLVSNYAQLVAAGAVASDSVAGALQVVAEALLRE